MNNAWKNHPVKKYAYLEYELVDTDGKIDPRPERNMGGSDLTMYNVMLAQADNDMKATARIHDATLGEGPVDKSGRALQFRQKQDQEANSHYPANRRYTMASVGRQLIYIFRAIYDVATIVRITGADDQKRKVMVYNGPDNDPRMVTQADGTRLPDPQFQLPKGVKEIYDIGTGLYDVEVTAAPHPGSRRQEDLDIMSKFVQVLPPQYMVNFMDLLFKLVDSPVGRQMSARADKMLPAPLRDQQDDQPEIPPEVQQQMAKAKEMVDGLTQQAQAMKQALDTKQVEQQGKVEIAKLQEVGELLRSREANETKLAVAELGAKVDRLTLFLEERARLGVQGHEAALAAADAHHERRMATLGHEQALEQGDAAAAREPAPAVEPRVTPNAEAP